MAGSIKLFKFFQKCQQTFGIHPRQPNPKQNQLSTNSIRTIVLIGFAQYMVTTTAFLLFDAKSTFEYGLGFCTLLTLVNCCTMYLIFIWKSENTLNFIENCEKFIEKRTQSTAAYNAFTGKIELFTKFFCFVVVMTAALALTALPYSYIRYYIFDMGEDSFYLLIPVWFDWKTPFGYLVAWLAQCTGVIAIGSIICQFSNLVIGSCLLFIFIAEDVTQDVVAFNITAKKTSNENRIKLRKRFCDMVQIYLDAKQCVTEFNQLSKYSLFVFISFVMLDLSSMLATIQFDLWADDSNLFEISLLIILLIWLILYIFLLCEPGARVTSQFEEFNDKLNRRKWYLLPIELQRCYLTFVSDTQNPIKVLCYANIVCERETSKKIIFKAWSFFMTLRKFEP